MASEGTMLNINGGMDHGSVLREVQQSAAVIHTLLEGPDQSERTKRISCTAQKQRAYALLYTRLGKEYYVHKGYNYFVEPKSL